MARARGLHRQPLPGSITPHYPFLFELKDRADKEDRVIRVNAHGPRQVRQLRPVSEMSFQNSHHEGI